MKKYNVIDLFSGAGGFSEGFMQTEKFQFLAHIEWESPMIETLRNNLVNRWGYSEVEAKKSVIKFDLQKTEELLTGSWTSETKNEYGKDNLEELAVSGLDGIVGKRKIDVIIGGPPCQAYSIAGRAQDPNSMRDDYRNYLFESFVKVVDHYKPKLFVFENVPGILSAKPGDKFVIDRIFEAFDEIGYEIRNSKEMKLAIYSSADFQVPQERNRVIIIGVNKKMGYNLNDFYEALDLLKSKAPKKNVRDALGNLPRYFPLDNPVKVGGKNISHKLVDTNNYSLHEPRYHNMRDIGIFKTWISERMNYIPNHKKLEYYNMVIGKNSNHNKYRSLEWDKPSPTVVSHLYKDGLMFIHPDINQLRSITVREAAILQTFPNDFEFIGSNAYCFKMIGNAVPVLFAKNIAQAIINVLEKEK